MMEITGKTVLITGASYGIGRAAAVEFASAGAKLVLLARSLEKLRSLQEALKPAGTSVFVVKCDVSRPAEVNEAVSAGLEHFGRVDIVINNAGVGMMASVEEMDLLKVEYLMAVNFYGPINVIKAVLPAMKKQGSGQIVNVSSIIGKRAIPYNSAYCASKFALNALTDALRIELRPYRIDVTLVCPGLTDTEFGTHVMREREMSMRFSKGASAGSAARAIVRSCRRRSRDVNLTAGGRFLLFVNRWSPRLVDYGLGRYTKKMLEKQESR